MSELNSALEHPTYNYKVVRQFAVMTVVWGIVGMLVGRRIGDRWGPRVEILGGVVLILIGARILCEHLLV